jgi:hypothetical protein
MKTNLLHALENKTITEEELFQKIEQNTVLLNEVLHGIYSPKAAVRYGCAKALLDLSEKHPEELYPHMQVFIDLLRSKYRILTWNALAIIANLTKVDNDRKFDAIFNEYYTLLNNEYMVTVANVVRNSAEIALAKPYLSPKITDELLKVEKIALSPHLTEECRRVIIEQVIKSFDKFFEKIEAKEQVISFVKRQLNSSRTSLRRESQRFLKNRNKT